MMMSSCIANARDRALVWVAACAALAGVGPEIAQADPTEKVIIDTDIGTDIDDAFAVALALRSPELQILGFSTASGDTEARARIIDRMLGEVGYDNIPVVAGPSITDASQAGYAEVGLQRRFGDNGRFVKASHRSARDFILEQIKRYPGQVTLVALGPLTNVGELIDADMATFRKLKRVVMMGGWIQPVLDDVGQVWKPHPEYNIKIDVPAAQKLFRSGVPIFVAPTDSTRYLAFDEVKRREVFSLSSPLTDSLALLYVLGNRPTPVLYDIVPLAFLVEPELCPMQPMNILMDDTGLMRVGTGSANAHVCIRSDANALLSYYMKRIRSISPEYGGGEAAVGKL